MLVVAGVLTNSRGSPLNHSPRRIEVSTTIRFRRLRSRTSRIQLRNPSIHLALPRLPIVLLMTRISPFD